MEKLIYSFCRAMAVLGILCFLYACAVTTQTTESSSNTVQNSTESSSKFTSSTSPGGDSDSAQREQALAFSKIQLERIKTDMAMGGGEHLTSLATLLGVPAHNQQEFFTLTKENFSTLFSSEETTAEEMLARLDDELDANPNLLR